MRELMESPFLVAPLSPLCGLFNAWTSVARGIKRLLVLGKQQVAGLPRGLPPGVPSVAHAEALLEKVAQLHQARVELLDGQGKRGRGRDPLMDAPPRTP